MIEIPLTHGYVAMVDDEDYPLVSGRKWSAVSQGSTIYAVYRGSARSIFMHRLIVGLAPGRIPEVDHKDGNGLNNTRENLRIATHAQNMANCNKHRHSTQPYKGIYKEGNRWRARITFSGKKMALGSFDTAEAAALTYDSMARKLFGEFARLNFPDILHENNCPSNPRKPNQFGPKCRLVTINGKTNSLAGWCREYGISWKTVSHRIYSSGLDPVTAITKPLGRTSPKNYKK